MASEDDILALLSEPCESDELVDLSNSFSDLLSTSTGSDEKTVELSPEEAAWVDSCLALDAELSDDDWAAFTEALLDTLSTQNSHDETEYVNGAVEGRRVQITERSETEVMYVEERDDDADVEDEAEAEAALIRDEERDKDTSEGDANAEDSEEVEQEAESRESIFKVWDLETPISNEEEDDELIEELNKLLIGGSSPEGAFRQPPYEPSRTVIQEKIIDVLAANMTDLSLRPLDD